MCVGHNYVMQEGHCMQHACIEKALCSACDMCMYS